MVAVDQQLEFSPDTSHEVMLHRFSALFIIINGSFKNTYTTPVHCPNHVVRLNSHETSKSQYTCTKSCIVLYITVMQFVLGGADIGTGQDLPAQHSKPNQATVRQSTAPST